jgi:hypothetical protein
VRTSTTLSAPEVRDICDSLGRTEGDINNTAVHLARARIHTSVVFDNQPPLTGSSTGASLFGELELTYSENVHHDVSELVELLQPWDLPCSQRSYLDKADPTPSGPASSSYQQSCLGNIDPTPGGPTSEFTKLPRQLKLDTLKQPFTDLDEDYVFGEVMLHHDGHQATNQICRLGAPQQ